MVYQMALLISGAFTVYRLAEATAKIAGNKGANANIWFVTGILLPGVALVLALFLDDQMMKQKGCPTCCRRVDQLARICGYCGHDFRRDQLAPD